MIRYCWRHDLTAEVSTGEAESAFQPQVVCLSLIMTSDLPVDGENHSPTECNKDVCIDQQLIEGVAEKEFGFQKTLVSSWKIVNDEAVMQHKHFFLNLTMMHDKSDDARQVKIH